MSRLIIKNISKSYKRRKVVDSITFDVRPGQVVGLLGPNGAGKTTSFYMVVGLIPSDTGHIYLGEMPIEDMPMFQRARAGLSYLPQEPSVFRKMTVKENIIVALEAHGIVGDTQQEKLNKLLKDFHIEHIAESYGFSLSGGERRRVEIARALAGSPKFLLLDEPFAGIDPIAVGDLQNLIRGLIKSGIGVLITDHNVRETLGICDFSYILKDGKIHVEGTPKLIAENELARRFYLGENFKL
ncbi:MAG: LPS export ABC transporter ATP-binding protein [Pseudomonadota bacterium]|nr:LPS export ABC transporter ATP-binding protein [Pseudomonadota bacterium]